jgi:hypothetical protein
MTFAEELSCEEILAVLGTDIAMSIGVGDIIRMSISS